MPAKETFTNDVPQFRAFPWTPSPPPSVTLNDCFTLTCVHGLTKLLTPLACYLNPGHTKVSNGCCNKIIREKTNKFSSHFKTNKIPIDVITFVLVYHCIVFRSRDFILPLNKQNKGNIGSFTSWQHCLYFTWPIYPTTKWRHFLLAIIFQPHTTSSPTPTFLFFLL